MVTQLLVEPLQNELAHVGRGRIRELRENRPHDGVALVPADEVGLAKTQPERRKDLFGNGRAHAAVLVALIGKAHLKQEEWPAESFGALLLDLEQVPKRLLVVRRVESALRGNAARVDV